MTEREERLGLNESAHRAVNEAREPDDARSAGATFRAVCECAQPDCDRTFEVTLAEYEAVRNDPRRFMVVVEHVAPEEEDIVERMEVFVVVLKQEGTAAGDSAIEQDPRT